MATKNPKKPLVIELSDAVKFKIAEDPELAKAMESVLEKFHAVADAVNRGEHDDINKALEAMDGEEVKPLTKEEGAKINAKLAEEGFDEHGMIPKGAKN